MTTVWDIDTPTGLARAHLHPVANGRPRAALVLGHGFGRGVDSPDLVAVAAQLPAHGIEVVLFEQPWRVAGRKLGGAPPTLDPAWVAGIRDVRSRGIGTRRLVIGGRSAGARIACRTVEETEPDALLLLAFPVHPARRTTVTAPPPTRMPELVGAARLVPTVVVQGLRDRLGAPEEIALSLAEENVTARVVPVTDADHSFTVPARSATTTELALDHVVRAARATSLRLVDGPY